MSKYSSGSHGFGMFVRKSFLSLFVIVTFLAYVLHEHFTNPVQPADGGNSDTSTTSNGADSSQGREFAVKAQQTPIDAGMATGSNTPDATPSSTLSPTETPAPQPGALYKNGTYTGSEADAYYGMVQVEAVIENGKISAVNFLEYPNHRRTSVRINSQAIPWLQQEAIQAQSAQVDLISGATLTSEAFVASLQNALTLAKN